jgi:bifunctional UDP-N-acetylglucosamine pyrophosphorylase / glucosamine-1-phosphate N-acetyltransferase
MSLTVVVMAAGQGTRMKSTRPKVLHRLAGHSLLDHVLATVDKLGATQTIVVTGHGAEQVEASIVDAAHRHVQFARQQPQRGTGHAVQQAVPLVASTEGTALVLNGDVPLISNGTLRRLVDASGHADGARRLALLTTRLRNPSGYGRIVREGDTVRAIVEHKDASESQRTIDEVYTGSMAAPTEWLAKAVMALSDHNAQKEYYLTDVVAAAVREGMPVVAVAVDDETEVLGVNSPVQLADLERRHQRRTAEALMEDGVRLADPARLDVRGTLTCGRDVEIDIDCIFEGEVCIGDGARIGSHCVIRNAIISAGATILPFTHMDGEAKGVRIGPGATVGPFARLRPGAELGPDVHVGNFVEIKNSTLGAGSKANHLAYLGDATVGARVNYGAGSITANYDGANKHRTVIGDEVHVGSNCVLVAPVTVGAGATIGAGSTINRDAPAGKLSVARGRQTAIDGWVRPRKKPKG